MIFSPIGEQFDSSFDSLSSLDFTSPGNINTLAKKMADIANDLFIFGDDFKVILGIQLDSDGRLEEQFVSAVSEVSARCFNRNRVLA